MLNEKKVIFTERWLLVALGSFLLCLGISGISLWIDEAYSARLAVQPTLAAWASTLYKNHGSESQMPGYVLYLWGWVRLFGASEWSLRLANLPWALLFTASLAWCAECILMVRRVWLIICLSPFMWFYMNEARPYAMLTGLSMLTTVAVLAYANDPLRFRFAPWWAMPSLFALWAAHMLTITLVPSLALILFAVRPVSAKGFIKHWIWPVVITLPLFLCLALYYLCTLVSGKGGMIEKPGFPNLIFALYELLGFGGLGPPRNVMRQSPGFHVLVPYIPSLAFGVLALGIVTFTIFLYLRHSNESRTVAVLFIAFATGLLFTFALSYAAHFRLLGRHVATFFPLLALLLLAGLRGDSNRLRFKFAAVALLFLGVAWSVSDFRQRLLPSYEKDDYRDAAALARVTLMRREPVLWLADTEVAKYYGLRTAEVPKPGSITPPDDVAAVSGGCSRSWFQQSFQEHEAILVVMSDKPDLFDRDGNCRKILDSLSIEHVASFPAFNAWQVTGGKSSLGGL